MQSRSGSTYAYPARNICYVDDLAAYNWIETSIIVKKSAGWRLAHYHYSDTAEGMFISTDKHMVSIQVKKNRGRFDNYQLTEAEKAEAFTNTYFSGAGSWSCEGNKATFTVLHHAHPNLEGTSRTFEFELEGDTMKYWPLNADGERGGMSMARKVE